MKVLLLVDDCREQLEKLKNYFQADYRVYLASSGQEALGMARRLSPHLILSDWDMPNGNGLWLLQGLKDEGIQIPIMLLSESVKELPESLANNGAVTLLNKPSEFNDLEREITQLFLKLASRQ